MLLDLLFPKSCLGCGKLGSYVCHNCRAQFLWIPVDGCLYCDKVTEKGSVHANCQRPGGIDMFQAFVYYSPVIRQIIKEIKYHLVSDAIPDLWYSLHPLYLAKLSTFTRKTDHLYIQPIPLHKHRLNARGFNQSDIIAQLIQKTIGGSYVAVLERGIYTGAQARTQNRAQRYSNIKGAFRVKEGKTSFISGKTFLLVDDVVTTGNTMKEAAAVLKKHGAARVFCVAFARD